MAVNVGNATNGKIRVKSAYTGREIEIAPAHFKKLPHTSGDLLVTTESNAKLKFPNVAPAEVGRNFWGGGDNIVGADSIVLNVLLQTNMHLYALLPGKKTVDENVEQPKGYPKVGVKIE